MCTFELSGDAHLADPRGTPRGRRGPKATAAQVVERSAGSAWDELVKSRTGGVQKSALEFFFKTPGSRHGDVLRGVFVGIGGESSLFFSYV